MKAKIIIANWLLSFLLLTYTGENVAIGIILVAYFGLSMYAMANNKKAICRQLVKWNWKIDKYLKI